jgi:protein-disulfide isomerase
VVSLARHSGIFLSTVFLLALVGPGCKAQSSGGSGALTPEITRRIQLEIRSRYNVPPSINVALADPKPSDIPGYDLVVVTFSGGTHTTTHDFLISKDRKSLAHLEKFDISQDPMAKIDVKGRAVRGNSDAKVTIVNYDDFQCPYCSRMHAQLFPGMLQAYGDRVKIIYKDYPLTEIHPWAMHAAIDANCLAEQSGAAYWDFADYVHANQKAIAGHSRDEAMANLDKAATEQAEKNHLDVVKAQACFKKQDESAVRASMAEGDGMGVDSTPTLFINGERITGLIPEGEMRAILDRALGETGKAAAATTPAAGEKR